jgi:hypothetical protein
MDKEAQDTIDAYVKAQLESEGISQPSAAPSVKVKKPNPPAHIPGETPTTNVEGEPTASEGEPSNEEENPNIKRFRQIAELERQKKLEEQQSQGNLLTGLIAGGAGAGALARYKGVELNGNLLGPSKTLFNQDEKFNPQTSEKINSISDAIQNHQDTLEKINAKIRATLQNPNVTYSTDQNSPGARWAAKVVNQDRPDTSVTEASSAYNRSKGQGPVSGRMTKLWGARQVQEPGQPPVNRLDQMSAQREAKAAQATAEQQAALDLLAKQHESETTKMNLEKQNMQKEANLAQSRGYRSGALKMMQGTIGGATLLPDVYGMYKKYSNKKTPLDSYDAGVDAAKITGDLAMTFGGPRLGTLGAALQLPWAIQNREALLRGMTMGDINPTAFPGSNEPVYDENAIRPR